MSKVKFKFGNKKHSIGGMISASMALLAIILLIVAVVISTKARGEAGTNIGKLGNISLILSVFGLIFGLIGFKEYDKNYVFASVGSIVCGLLAIFLIVLILI